MSKMIHSPLTGVILAGGENRRMGGYHKALLLYDQEPLVRRQIRLLQQICSKVILVTNEPSLFGHIVSDDVTIIPDVYPGKGPLSGIHAALSVSRHEQAWVVACDMPFPSPQAAELMIEVQSREKSSAVIPYIDNRLHPLHGIYDRTCSERIPELLRDGRYRVMDFLEAISCVRVPAEDFQRKGIDLGFVLNVNTPEEYMESLQGGAGSLG